MYLQESNGIFKTSNVSIVENTLRRGIDKIGLPEWGSLPALGLKGQMELLGLMLPTRSCVVFDRWM